MPASTATCERAATKPLPMALSDLTFNYIVCARAYMMDPHAKDPHANAVNLDEEELAIDVLLRLFNETMGYAFTREDLLAEVERRS